MTVNLQCQRCGSGRAAKKALYKLEELPDFDLEIAVRYRSELTAQFEARQAQWTNEQMTKTGDWWQKYNDYLNSPNWRLVRNAVLRRDPICQKCFFNRSEQAHHLSYESYNKWRITFPVECVGLCFSCHQELHS